MYMASQTSGPYYARKSRKNACYRVKNKTTRRVFSKCTTKEKGKRQLGYLTTYLEKKLGRNLQRTLQRNLRKTII